MNNSTDNDLLLEDLNHTYAEEYIPATILLTTVIFIGVVSNLFVFIFYAFKSPRSVINFMISLVSLNDALVDIVMIHDAVEFNYFVNYRNIALCKVTYFLKHFLVFNTISLTVAIAVDRYRLVCHPFLQQITIKMAQGIAITICIVSFTVSVPYFWIAEIATLTFKGDNELITAFHCSLSDKSPKVTVLRAFFVVDVCIHAIYLITLIISYYMIIRQVIRIRQKLNTYKPRGSNAPTSSSCRSAEEMSTLNISVEKITTESQMGRDCHSHYKDFSTTELDIADSSSSAKQPKLGLSRIDKKEIKLTIMTFAITIANVVCFVPYYLSMLFIEASMDGTSLLYTVGELMARRSFTLYSVITPFILMFNNESLKHFVFNIFTCK